MDAAGRRLAGAAGPRLAACLGLLLVLGLGWALRMADAPTVFTDAGIRAAGPDAYYHLRRSADALARFPAVLHHDRYLNHPHGGDVIWPPGLAFATAASARVALGPEPPREAFERFALSQPVWLGVLAVAWAALFAARRFGLAAGLVTGALLAVLPGHALYTRLGMFDHHALEVPFTLAFLSSAGALWRAAQGGRRAAPGVVAFGATTAAAFLVWPGLLLQLGLVDLVIAGAVFLGAPAPWRRRLAFATAAAHGLAALALLPWAATPWTHWGHFAPVVLGAFQPWLLVSAAVVLAVGGWRGRSAAAARLAAGVGAAVVLLTASAVAAPELIAVPSRMWGWLGRADGFQAQVSESLPLFAAGLADPVRLLSLLAFASPVVWALYARDLRRRARDAPSHGSLGDAPSRGSLGDAPPEGWLLAAMALGLGMAALAQRRFANAFSVTEALLFGWWLGAVLPAWLRARAVGRAGRVAVGVAAAGASLAALAPVTQVYGPIFERRAQHAAGQALRLPSDVWRRHELHRLADWLREATPTTAGFDDPDAVPEYGVLAHWSDGHVIEYVGRRPTVVTNFGDDLGEENWAAMARYFAADEAGASALLDRLGVRYVVLEWRPQPPLDPFEPRSMVARGFFADGGVADASPRSRSGSRMGGPERVEVLGHYPAFERHRLVQEAGPKPWAPEQPFFKVYEHVAGARVEGASPPGSSVRFELELETPLGRRFVWASETRADGDGRYRVRLPYATVGAPPSVRPAAAYRVTIGGREAGSLAIPEAAVLEGLAVAGPGSGEVAP